MEEEFAEDEAYGPDVDGFCVFAGAEEEFWGAVPKVRRLVRWPVVPDCDDLRSHWSRGNFSCHSKIRYTLVLQGQL